jgi:hypothetical protein
LKEAIAMEQSLLRKIMELADNVQSLTDLLDLLEITSKAHNRLASLLRTQSILTGNANDDLSLALTTALTNVRHKLHLD